MNGERASSPATVDVAADKQIVLAWLDREGQTITGTENGRVEIRYYDGTLIWSKSDLVTDARGVFLIEQEGITDLFEGYGNNFMMVITIELDGKDYKTVQPFYTIG